MKSTYDVLIQQGFVLFPKEDENLIDAPRAFFGARAIEWIRNEAVKPDFDLQPYVVALTYYKLGLGDLKFEDNELLYRYTGIKIGGFENESVHDTPETLTPFHRPCDHPQTNSTKPLDDDQS